MQVWNARLTLLLEWQKIIYRILRPPNRWYLKVGVNIWVRAKDWCRQSNSAPLCLLNYRLQPYLSLLRWTHQNCSTIMKTIVPTQSVWFLLSQSVSRSLKALKKQRVWKRILPRKEHACNSLFHSSARDYKPAHSVGETWFTEIVVKVRWTKKMWKVK